MTHPSNSVRVGSAILGGDDLTVLCTKSKTLVYTVRLPSLMKQLLSETNLLLHFNKSSPLDINQSALYGVVPMS